MDYAKARTVVHGLILSHLKCGDGTRAFIEMTMVETDDFHTDTFHDIVKEEDGSGRLEVIAECYSEVRDLIYDFLETRYNFGTSVYYGKIEIDDVDDVTDEDITHMILTIG